MARVLLIDDEGLVRSTLRSALEVAGHSVVEAANGRDGLELLALGPFDVVITDILMPVMEGIETILAIKRSGVGVKVIAISGASRRSNVDFLQAAQRLGADAILHKPFPMADLIAAVARCLEKPTAEADGPLCGPG